jgi:hypothetical protein
VIGLARAVRCVANFMCAYRATRRFG